MEYRVDPRVEARLGKIPMTHRGSHLVQPGRERGRFRRDGVVVELDRGEILDLSMLGMERMLASELRGRKPGNEADRTYENDIRGILAEGAFCKAMGMDVRMLLDDERTSIAELRRGDVGQYQIRTTDGMQSSEKNGKVFYSNRLIYRHTDNAEDIFVLVIGSGALYEIAGWMRGREVMTVRTGGQGAEHRTTAWFAWVEDVHPIQTLPGAPEGAFREHVVMSEHVRAVCGEVEVREVRMEEEEEEQVIDIDARWAEIRVAHMSVPLVAGKPWERRAARPKVEVALEDPF